MGRRKRKLVKNSKFSKHEVRTLKAVFDSHDADASGSIDVKELMATDFQAFGVRFNASAFRLIDQDGDGELSFKEYLAVNFPEATKKELATMEAWATKQTPEEETQAELTDDQFSELEAMFKMFDQDRSGSLERFEIVSAASVCGYDSDEIEALFDSADTDGNDSLTFEEFVQLMKEAYIT